MGRWGRKNRRRRKWRRRRRRRGNPFTHIYTLFHLLDNLQSWGPAAHWVESGVHRIQFQPNWWPEGSSSRPTFANFSNIIFPSVFLWVRVQFSSPLVLCACSILGPYQRCLSNPVRSGQVSQDAVWQAHHTVFSPRLELRLCVKGLALVLSR